MFCFCLAEALRGLKKVMTEQCYFKIPLSNHRKMHTVFTVDQQRKNVWYNEYLTICTCSLAKTSSFTLRAIVVILTPIWLLLVHKRGICACALLNKRSCPLWHASQLKTTFVCLFQKQGHFKSKNAKAQKISFGIL